LRSLDADPLGGAGGFGRWGALVVATEDRPSEALEAGDGFDQALGEWHVVSTGAAGPRRSPFEPLKGANPFPSSRSVPSNARLQLPPKSSFQSVRGTVRAAGSVPQRWRSALLGAAEPHVSSADETACSCRARL